MGTHQDSFVEFHSLDQGPDMSPADGIHTCCGLIHKKNEWVTHCAESDTNSSSHATRILADLDVACFPEADITKSLLDKLIKVFDIDSLESLE